MKFCKDCKYCIMDGRYFDMSTCNAPQNRTTRSLVTGNAEWDNNDCLSQRDAGFFEARVYSRCGREGRWFELRAAPPKGTL